MGWSPTEDALPSPRPERVLGNRKVCKWVRATEGKSLDVGLAGGAASSAYCNCPLYGDPLGRTLPILDIIPRFLDIAHCSPISQNHKLNISTSIFLFLCALPNPGGSWMAFTLLLALGTRRKFLKMRRWNYLSWKLICIVKKLLRLYYQLLSFTCACMR